MSLIRNKLIAAGVKNLREYGYPQCNESNILTDRIYSAFFVSMLESNRGHDRRIDAEIEGLLQTLKPAKADDAVARGPRRG